MKIGIGIDTGGTYTDAVAYDFETETLLAKGKALTTRENLATGIGQALDMLPAELIRDALLVSLSTTLATNAVLEDKGGRAKMLLFGLADEHILRFKAENYGLRTDSVRGVDTHGSADGLIVDEPDWDAVLAEHGAWLADADTLSAAELYAIYNGAPCEKRVKKLSEERFGLPFTSASELTSEVNVLVRAATALLNARLSPIVREFVEAAITDFSARQCGAPVMVVRSDGSLMSSDLSTAKPVETILSGPAASVLAGKYFSEDADYVIIDMGGTTTDVSVVRGGKPVTAEGGIQLGGWQTAVKGVFVDPFALGGDSAVRLSDGKLQLFPRRATPICVAARRWPEIKTQLAELLDKKHINRYPLHEFFYLVREPAKQKIYDRNEMKLLDVLRKGPCMLANLDEAAGIDIYHFDSERLEAEGVVMRCGLTPTDFMHIKGDFAEYDREASELAAKYLLTSMRRRDTPEEIRALADEVYGLVEGRLYENLLRILLTQQYPRFKSGIDEQTEFLIREAWAKRDAEKPDGALFRYTLGTDVTLVGVGAPTHIFLPAVAKALGTKCVLPEHAEVANALGSLKADINVVTRVEISQRIAGGAPYYIVHSPSGSRRFDDLNAAQTEAQTASEQAAIQEARSRGAEGPLNVNTYMQRHNVVSSWGTNVELGLAAVSEVAMHLG
ncbi:MAG: hydantoinase/oxoprolinase family protein [Oscillospiraceae bacterium]|jgi:N-methylhydantoinase A/oxoprolinase/acetone carboxylase beta subunit|nr:hydantoinase/oxoprolinase family protein [Oscillospiraceae bacterium]